VRRDVTRGQIYTLSDQTLQLLEGLKDTLTVDAFLADVRGHSRPEILAAQQRRMVNDMLEDYARIGQNHVRYNLVDPYTDVARVEELGVETNLTVVFEYRGDRVQIGPERLFSRTNPFAGTAPKFNGEEAFTGAILKLLGGKSTRVYVLEGHDERRFDSGQPRDYSKIRRVLERERYELESLNLATAPAVPADADVLIVAGPRLALAEAERGRLEEFFHRPAKGALFFFDYTTDLASLGGWRSLTANMGVDLTPYIAVEMDERLQTIRGSPNFFIPQYDPHEITDPLRSGRLPLVIHSGIVLKERPSLPDGWSVKPLLRTTGKGWGESSPQGQLTFDGTRDLPGPAHVAYALEHRAPHHDSQLENQTVTPEHTHSPDKATVSDDGTATRVVIHGDADIVSDSLQRIVAGSANTDLFMNALGWVSREREATATLRPRDPEATKIDLMGSQQGQIFKFYVLILPGIPLLIGFLIGYNRRYR